MWLVKYALKFRITFYVMSILILLAGVGAFIVMPKDVLPRSISRSLRSFGPTPGSIRRRWKSASPPTPSSRSATTSTASANMESTTLQGVTITRIYFQPDVSIDLALSQVTASTNSIRAVLPPGIQPPVVMRFSASSVPVIQLALSSNSGERASALRLRPVPHPPDTDDGARFDAAVALWRAAATDHGRSGSARAAGITD